MQKVLRRSITADSYDALADIVAEAKQNEDESRDDSYIEKIRTAVNELVNVTALRAQLLQLRMWTKICIPYHPIK